MPRGAVGILAGRGALPPLLAQALRRAGRAVVVAHPEGLQIAAPQGCERLAYRVEKLGALFRGLRERGVGEVVLAGGIDRPKLQVSAFDLKTAALAPRILAALKAGDDGLLRVVLAIFEAEGFAVRAAQDLAPELLPAEGVPTAARPSARDREDAARAAAIVAALSAVDVGQGAVVAQGVALAVEAAPGTDAMLAQVAAMDPARRPAPDAGRGILYKAPKLGQDRRVDLPAIGPQTFQAAAEAGLAGIVVAAGGVMLLEPERALPLADAAGLFLWVRPS